MKKLLLILLSLAFYSSNALADIIIFKSGSDKQGIVDEESPTGVKIRIKNAVIGISWANIERIEYATPEENRLLDQKWRDEQKERDEERKRNRAEREKREKQQRDKGLVKVGDEWVTRDERARRRDEGIRESMQAQEAADAEAAEAEAEAEQEPEPDYLAGLTEEEKRQFKEDIKKVPVSGVTAVRLGDDSVMVKGRVKNTGEFAASIILLEITIYDKTGEIVVAGAEEITDLGPGQSRGFNFPASVAPGFVGNSKVQVIGVEWR